MSGVPLQDLLLHLEITHCVYLGILILWGVVVEDAVLPSEHITLQPQSYHVRNALTRSCWLCA